MKKQAKHSLRPTQLAISATTITTTATLFATILASMTNIKTITPFIQTLYAPLGYSISLPGAILGAFYIAIDTFILTYLFAWIYNKLL